MSDQQIYETYFDGNNWQVQRQVPSATSPYGPALAIFNNAIYVIWRSSSDSTIYWATFDGNSWLSAPQQVPNIGSSTTPTAVAFNGSLYMAWVGIGTDQGLYWSSYDGSSWADQQQISGISSTTGPAFAVFNGSLYMTWKGGQNNALNPSDASIYWSTFDGSNWTNSQQVPNTGTSFTPALAVSDNLYMAWRGKGTTIFLNDDSIHWASFDGSNWTDQQEIPNIGTSVSPALAVFNGSLYMAWKGASSDNSIWWSSYDGSNWTNQQKVPDVGTGDRPALVPFNGNLNMFWRGV